MKIGIKYCGGCNPRYNRKELVGRLRAQLSDDVYMETVKEGHIYDVLLVLGGCFNCCADHKDIHVTYRKIFITGEQDENKTLNLLKEMK